jgi:hypothetical protein
MLKNTTSSKLLTNYMYQCKFSLTFQENTTIHNSQLNHIGIMPFSQHVNQEILKFIGQTIN